MNNKFLLINALTKESYQDCHIKGSINIPLDDLKKEAQKLDKNSEIIVYCANYECPVSKEAWHVLKDLGFKNIRAYEGGMREWFEAGLPTEGACTHYKRKSDDPAVLTITAEELRKKMGIK